MTPTLQAVGGAPADEGAGIMGDSAARVGKLAGMPTGECFQPQSSDPEPGFHAPAWGTCCILLAIRRRRHK
jgi:hypothetical protein